MTIKEKVLRVIEEGIYTGPSETARQLKCSSQAVWYAIRELVDQGEIEPAQPYKLTKERK